MNLAEAERRAPLVGEQLDEAAGRGRQPITPLGRTTVPFLIGAIAVAVGVALRFWVTSPLWLDEAQAVAIARLPVGRLLDALRQDGAPPLYYLLLHGWMRLFGTGTGAVRLLSVGLGLLALPLGWRCGLYVGGRRVAASLVVLLAASPFAIRYSTEVRMYSLVLLLVLSGLALVLDPVRPVDSRRLAAIAAVVAALLLTHYWAFFLIGAAAIGLGCRLLLDRHDRTAALLLGAVAVGVLPFLPWLPSFWFQLQHTGAPWGPPPGVAVVELALRSFAGGDSDPARLLELLLFAVAGSVALSGWTWSRGAGGRRSPAQGLVALALGTLLLGAIATRVTGDAFAARHAAVAFPPLLAGVAAGICRIDPPRIRHLVLGAAGLLGLSTAMVAAPTPRTQADEVAAALRASVQPGDVVVACPDQLVPAIHRLEAGLPIEAVPGGNPPGRVDWTDYQRRVRRIAPRTLAADLDARAGRAAVWLISSPNYAGIGSACHRLQLALAQLRPGRSLVKPRPEVLESARVWWGPAPWAVTGTRTPI